MGTTTLPGCLDARHATGGMPGIVWGRRGVGAFRDKSRRRPACFADGLSQGGEVIVLAEFRMYVVEPQQFPPEGCGDGTGVMVAQVPTVGLAVRGEWPDHRRRLGVGVRQGGHGGFTAARAGTASELAHGDKV